jgi:mannose-6-phosphate isomerase-like protein (cupin superfamily)
LAGPPAAIPHKESIMTEPAGKLINVDELEALDGDSSFAALLRQDGDDIRRDVFMLMNSEDSASGRLQVGMTIVYPGCRTNGHAHADREEVYFFTRGKGMMGVDGEEWQVKAGDAFYVKPGPLHTTRNPYDVPLEFFWITINVE